MLHIILGVVSILVTLLIVIIICILHQRRKTRLLLLLQKDEKGLAVRYVTRASSAAASAALDGTGSPCNDRLLREKTEKVSIV